MKKLLFQLDTDPHPSVFDAVVAHDGGVDALSQLANVKPSDCRALAEGAIFTRGPKQKKNTALFIGGSDLAAGETVFKAIQDCFFDYFRVSLMLDSNGCNTTAAAAVAQIASSTPLAERRAVVLAGTGPVGMRAAALLALHGATVTLTSRSLTRSEHARDAIKERFSVQVHAAEAGNPESTAAVLEGAQILLAAGKSGIELLDTRWQAIDSLHTVADLSASPPSGLAGVEIMDKATARFGKSLFGGIGIGAFKLRLHRACIEHLFEANDRVLDAEAIYGIAESLLASS